MLPAEGFGRGGKREGWKTYRCLPGKCYPKSEAMKLKTISRDEQLEKLRKRYAGRGAEGKTR
jgi:hypothetical protein